MSEWIISAEDIDDITGGGFTVCQKLVRCKDCRWGKETCGNIECNVDLNLPSEYHGYEWFCPNGERKDDAVD